jgi:hypothetical protein
MKRKKIEDECDQEFHVFTKMKIMVEHKDLKGYSLSGGWQ